MTTPINAGSVEVDVVADASGFDRQLGAEVKRSLAGAQAQASRGGRSFGKRFHTMAVAAVAASAATQPIGAVALAGIGAGVAAFAAPLAAATAGIGAFAIVAVPAFSKVTKASEELAKAQEAVDHALTAAQRKSALAKQRHLLEALDPAQRAAVQSLDRFKGAFTALQKRLEPQIFGVFNSGLQAATAALPHLETLARATAPAIKELLDRLTKGLGGPGVKRAIDSLAARAPGAIKAIVKGVGDLAQGFGGLIRAFSPMSKGINSGLADMLDRFSRIGESQGLKDFINYVQQNAPMVRDVLRNVGEAVLKILEAVRPLGPFVLGSIGLLATLVNAIPTDRLTDLIAALFIAKAAVIAYGIAAKVAAGYTWLLNGALAANPVGATIAAVVALSAAVVYAYNRFETFRDIVNAVIKATTGTVVAFIGKFLGGLGTLFQVLGRLPGRAGANFREAARAVGSAKAKVDALSIAIDNLGRKKATPTVELLGDRGVLIRLQGVADAMNRLDRQVKPRVAGPKSINGGVTITAGATGGIVKRPTFALIGEAGPEAVVPLEKSPGNSPLPKGGLGGDRNLAVTQNFYVTEKQDADAQQRQAAFRFRVAAGV